MRLAATVFCFVFLLFSGATTARAEDMTALKAQAEQGDASAQYRLGYYYLKGLEGLTQDAKQAEEWWSKAAEQGDANEKYESLPGRPSR